ncbi:Hsp20/alpha crystallin family protein [Novisyntrophococcus fermenticellae]|uniref:Hsp20/alpha crystallin family protein n=1 Tax=Novisyntrophococcus fermenticellae TaxID=2068655 RepID=UPI001E582038|nr:Hsp20/alpha crystallin family protein [Novisyntrophococcus fermenticellae]
MLAPGVFGRDLFEDFFNDPWFDDKDFRRVEKKLYGHHAKNMMNTDVKETETGYKLVMDLPGFKKDEIQVSLENGYLSIRASKGLDEDKEDKNSGKYIHRERYAGACQRSFYVGKELRQEDIQASFKHGILKLDIPKPDKKQIEANKYIAIEG